MDLAAAPEQLTHAPHIPFAPLRHSSTTPLVVVVPPTREFSLQGRSFSTAPDFSREFLTVKSGNASRRFQGISEYNKHSECQSGARSRIKR